MVVSVMGSGLVQVRGRRRAVRTRVVGWVTGDGDGTVTVGDDGSRARARMVIMIDDGRWMMSG